MTNPGAKIVLRRAADRMADAEERARALAPNRPWIHVPTRLRLAAARNQRGFNYHALAPILNQGVADANCRDEEAASIFLQLVLYHAAKGVLDGAFVSHVPIPDSVFKLLQHEAYRIIGELSSAPPSPYRTDRDPLLKDTAILAGRLIPVGAELIELHSGIPRGVLLRGGFRQLGRGVLYFLAQRRGFRNYCALHMHSPYLQEFNPDGWHKTYLRIADLLRLNPAIQGVFGSAWFYDPAVGEISPHLAYLRTVREAGGARNFRAGGSPEATKDALLKSRRRRLLYEQGSYNPQGYFLTWHRRELLKWASTQKTDT